jgi:hypothetical protein
MWRRIGILYSKFGSQTLVSKHGLDSERCWHGEWRRAVKLARSAPAVVSRTVAHPVRRPCRRPLSTCIIRVTFDLFFKYLDATVATYKRRQIKHLKISVWNTYRNVWKTFENHCKHMQHLDKTLTNIHMKHLKTLKTQAYNIYIYFYNFHAKYL